MSTEKTFVVESIRITIQILKHLDKMKMQFLVICTQPSKFPYIHSSGSALNLFAK